MVALILLASCAPAPEPCACETVPLPEAQIVDLAGFTALLDVARPVFYPDLEGASIEVVHLDDVRYFQANLDLSTVSDPPMERKYLVQVDPTVFDDPPSNDVFRAVIAHELGHVQDYVGKNTDELVSFALWYLGGDVADYEHATDEKALTRGCAAGLTAYREWLYEHVDADLLVMKQTNYYTPEEIAAWSEANVCSP